MTADKLLKQILDKSGLLPRSFSRWVNSSDQFREFAKKHKDKICPKFAEAKTNSEPDEKLKDVLFELEIAYLALRTSRFSVEYELYGGGPDFTLTDESGVVFNVEVKRIRKTSEEKRLEAWRAQVKREVCAVPSTLAVAVDIGLYVDELNALLDLLDRLERKRADVIGCLVKTIRAEERNIPIDGIKRYPIPSFEDEVQLTLSKPSRKPTSDHTTFNGGIFPPFITQKEWEKFKDLIFTKKKQRIPNMINILVISTDSATHDIYAFMKEIEEDFKERVARGNVTEQMKKLSGVLFRGAWENRLWLNNRTAYCPIPKNIAETLEAIYCGRGRPNS